MTRSIRFPARTFCHETNVWDAVSSDVINRADVGLADTLSVSVEPLLSSIIEWARSLHQRELPRPMPLLPERRRFIV